MRPGEWKGTSCVCLSSMRLVGMGCTGGGDDDPEEIAKKVKTGHVLENIVPYTLSEYVIASNPTFIGTDKPIYGSLSQDHLVHNLETVRGHVRNVESFPDSTLHAMGTTRATARIATTVKLRAAGRQASASLLADSAVFMAMRNGDMPERELCGVRFEFRSLPQYHLMSKSIYVLTAPVSR